MKLKVMLMNIFTKWNKKSLIKDLKKAAETLSEYSGGYSGEHLSAEEFYRDLVDRINKFENGDDSVIEDLWIWFAPTCQWDDFVGNVELGERIYQKIIKYKKSAGNMYFTKFRV